MRRFSKLRPTPAMAVALTALFISLGGVGYAASTGSIGTKAIKNNSVRSSDIRNSTIVSKDVHSRGLIGTDLKANSIGGNAVKESTLGQVPRAAVAGSVAAGGVTAASLGAGVVGSSRLGAVTQRPANAAIPAHSSLSVTRTCAAGEKLLSGGAFWSVAFTPTLATQLQTTHSFPSGNSWIARGYNNSDQARTFQVRAVCLTP